MSMSEMTSRERVDNILKGKPVDRIAVYEHFWGETVPKWRSQGHLKENETPAERFAFDIAECWPFNNVADLNFKDETIAEDEDTITYRNGNGAVLKKHKKHSATPEHVDFAVKDRSGWEEKIKPFLTPSESRINFEAYRGAKKDAAEKNLFFCWSGINVFEQMHPVAGHEYMLMGMAEDPDWVKDMCETYSNLTIGLMEILFAKEGKPDGIWFYEDMGFKGRPFMSPAMYKELVQPAHKKSFDYAHSLGLKVIVHSCGFVEPLLPGLTEAGMDCLQAIEVKAGMDPLRIKNNFGDKISLCGGMDARNLVANDIDAVRKELRKKIPALVKGQRSYILHSDHSIPDTCDFETFKFFVEEGIRLGTCKS
jgi:uroporphyrinogen decarboxylase